MSDLKLNAPNPDFFVTSFGPVELDKDHNHVEVGGVNLDKVVRAYIKDTLGIDQEVDIYAQTPERLGLEFNNIELPKKTMFFVIIQGEDSSWYPVGPMIKLE